MTLTVPPPQPGDRIVAAIARAALNRRASGLHILTVALVAADNPQLTPAEAVDIARNLADERQAAASARARALIEEAAQAVHFEGGAA